MEHYLDWVQLPEKPPLPAEQQWLTRMSSAEFNQVYQSISREVTTVKGLYKSMTGKSIDAMAKIDKLNEIAKKDFQSLQESIHERVIRGELREDRDEIVQSTIADSTSLWARVKDIWTYGNSAAAGGAATLDGKRVEEAQKGF